MDIRTYRGACTSKGIKYKGFIIKKLLHETQDVVLIFLKAIGIVLTRIRQKYRATTKDKLVQFFKKSYFMVNLYAKVVSIYFVILSMRLKKINSRCLDTKDWTDNENKFLISTFIRLKVYKDEDGFWFVVTEYLSLI